MFGRRRPVPELSSSNFMQRSFGERVAMNSPIQGTAADIIKIAMIRVHDRLLKENLKSRLILTVHDELLVETAIEEEDAVRKILEEEMHGAADLAVTLEIDAHVGKTGMRQNKDLSSFMRDDALDCICPDGTREKWMRGAWNG